jgi:hypothetical protein
MAPNTTQKCPSCGSESTGKFCNACGASLSGSVCGSCGAKLTGRGKFCADCGAPTGQPGGARSGDRTPWIVAGVAVVALVVTLVVVVARSGAPTQQSADTPAAGGPIPDLAQMSPREAADRLFDHVARAESNGDSAQVAQFAPMALQAYAMLGAELDPDARLHIGLVHLAVRNAAGATAEADTILRGSRTHLYGLLLKVRAAEVSGDAAGARRALQAFAAAYQAERAKNLPEYAMHDQLLLDTKTQAERGAGGTPAR